MFTIGKAPQFFLSEGIREAYLADIAERVNTNNKPYIDVSFKIRADVDQPNANAFVHEKIWMAKTPTEDDMAVGGYLSGRVFALAECADIPEGTEFNCLEDLFNAVLGSVMQIMIRNTESGGKVYSEAEPRAASVVPVSQELLQEIAKAKQERKIRMQEHANHPAQMPQPTQQYAQQQYSPQQTGYNGRYQTAAYTPPAQTPAFHPAQEDMRDNPFRKGLF
jgi:hypothetical protein